MSIQNLLPRWCAEPGHGETTGKFTKRLNKTLLGGGLAIALGLALPAGNPAAAQDSWETKDSMPRAWAFAFTGVIDGKFHVGGGSGDYPPLDPINKEHYAYDPSTNAWIARALVPIRQGGASAVVNGKIYVVGGCITDCHVDITGLLLTYDPGSDIPGGDPWSTLAPMPPMPTVRAGHVAAALDGKLFVVGGSSTWPYPHLQTIEVYDPDSNQWEDTTLKADMPTGRENASAAVIDGKLYVVGGMVRPTSNTHDVTGVLEVYDPVANTWSTLAPMPTPRHGAAMGVIGGKLHVVGGWTTLTFLATHEVYDPNTDSWSTLEPMPAARGYPMAGVIDDKLYVAGGVGSIVLDTLEVFSPTVNLPPVADGGLDQSVRAGDSVVLDGSASFDDNTATADLIYAWTFTSIPAGSTAVLSGDATQSPSFVADVPGTYAAQLIVTDEDGLSGDADEVLISGDNLAPTANAGGNQLVVVADSVLLDGSASTDPEHDSLTYDWAITSAPAGSTAVLFGTVSAFPTFATDLEGVYEVTLVVSDFIGPGAPDTALITATTAETFAEIQIVESEDQIALLSELDVTTFGNQTALSSFLSQVVAAIQDGDINRAITKLEQAIERTDGCVERGQVDGDGPGRDWITDCYAQMEAYTLLNEALNALAS